MKLVIIGQFFLATSKSAQNCNFDSSKAILKLHKTKIFRLQMP